MAFSAYTGGTPSRQDPNNFSDFMDAWISWFTTNAAELAALMAATIFVDTGGSVSAWVSGASYTAGDIVYSTTDFQNYRAKTTHSGETTDPSSDATNWTIVSFDASPSFNSITLGGEFVETIHTLSGTPAALDPANGTIQVQTLTANTTHTDSLSDGESIVLMIDDGTGYTITWPTITWLTSDDSAPTLATTGYSSIVLQKIGSTLYGYVAKAG